MKLRSLFLIAILCCTTPAYPLFIIIHGSFASDRSWWTPQGRFFQEVESQARLLGESTISWCWSGYPSFAQIERAGHIFAKFIMSLPRNERLTVIAHSNAGNVVNVASAILYQPIEKICGQYGGASVTDVLASAYAQLNDTSVPTTAAFMVPLPTAMYSGMDYTHTLREVPTIKNAITDYKAKLRKVNIIDRAIYLGTPVDMQVYPPQMDVIGTLINCYSLGDSIQKVGGLFSRTYPVHPRRVNLQLFMKRHDRTLMTSPSHSELHVPYVGRWLPYIPEVLAATDKGVNNFKTFVFKQDGMVIFDEDTGPRYYRTKKPIEDAELAKMLEFAASPTQLPLQGFQIDHSDELVPLGPQEACEDQPCVIAFQDQSVLPALLQPAV